MNTSFVDKVLCVGLRTRCLGTSAKDEAGTDLLLEEYHAQKGSMKATKTYLVDFVSPLRSNHNRARTWFNSLTLPGLSPDLRLTTPARLPELQTGVQEFIDKDAEILAKQKPTYPDAIQKDRFRLGEGFDPTLYPDVENLHQFFQIGLQVCDMPQGDYNRIECLTASAKATMQEQHQKMLAAVGREARNTVYVQLTKLIKDVADKMSDTSAKRFHDATFSNLTEYLAIVPDLNITNDPALENLRKEASERLAYSMKVVKDSAFLKEQAAVAAKDILQRFGNVGGGRRLVA